MAFLSFIRFGMLAANSDPSFKFPCGGFSLVSDDDDDDVLVS